MLPGGQYAEKRLLLNVPAQTEEVLCKLPLNDQDVSHVIINFEKVSSNPKQVREHPVSMGNIRKALKWLIEHNPLYCNDNININNTFSATSEISSMSICVNNSLEENVLIPVNHSSDCVVHSHRK